MRIVNGLVVAAVDHVHADNTAREAAFNGVDHRVGIRAQDDVPLLRRIRCVDIVEHDGITGEVKPDIQCRFLRVRVDRAAAGVLCLVAGDASAGNGDCAIIPDIDCAALLRGIGRNAAALDVHSRAGHALRACIRPERAAVYSRRIARDRPRPQRRCGGRREGYRAAVFGHIAAHGHAVQHQRAALTDLYRAAVSITGFVAGEGGTAGNRQRGIRTILSGKQHDRAAFAVAAVGFILLEGTVVRRHDAFPGSDDRAAPVAGDVLPEDGLFKLHRAFSPNDADCAADALLARRGFRPVSGKLSVGDAEFAAASHGDRATLRTDKTVLAFVVNLIVPEYGGSAAAAVDSELGVVVQEDRAAPDVTGAGAVRTRGLDEVLDHGIVQDGQGTPGRLYMNRPAVMLGLLPVEVDLL